MNSQPNDGFEWVQAAGGPALVCVPLRPFADHLFTTREWALGSPAGGADPDWQPPALPASVLLQTHCHEYATFPEPRQPDLLRRLGISDVAPITGCCGLAGNFGFEAQHYDTSMAVAELALGPALRAAPRTEVLADGFSCQLQVAQLDPLRRVKHLAELLDRPIGAASDLLAD